jgi:tight adherence protein C
VLIFLIVILTAASVLAAVRYVHLAHRATGEAIETVASYGYSSAAAAHVGRAPSKPGELENRLASLARRASRPDYESRVRQRLIQAGLYTARPARFMALRTVCALAFATLGLLAMAGGLPPLVKLALVIGGLPLGWMLPDAMLSMRISRRREQIERDSADFIDLLAITVQAGLSLDQSIHVTSERLEGALADETRLMLNEVRVGQSRHDAMRRLAERCDTPTINSFARTMTQGEAMGVSIGQTLRGLAVDARIRKRNTAEERAQKAPVKMIFPLAICIFPAILLVAAGPGVIGIARALGGG